MTSGKNYHDLMRNVIKLIGNKHVAVFKHILNLTTFLFILQQKMLQYIVLKAVLMRIQ